MVLSRVISDFKNVVTLKSKSIGYSRSSEPTQIDPPPMTSC